MWSPTLCETPTKLAISPSVANAYGEDQIGAQALKRHITGTGLDTGRILCNIADSGRMSAAIREAGISQEQLVALVRHLVTDPKYQPKPGQAGIRRPARRVIAGAFSEKLASNRSSSPHLGSSV